MSFGRIAQSLVVAASLLGAACDDGFCDSAGFQVAIRTPDPDPDGYTFRIEFEAQVVELECSMDARTPGLWPGSCETTAGPWRVLVGYSSFPPEIYSHVMVVIQRDNDHPPLPSGEIVIRLSSDELEVERSFDPELDSACDTAVEEWHLADESPGP